jgi:hypothetical protein
MVGLIPGHLITGAAGRKLGGGDLDLGDSVRRGRSSAHEA